MGGKQSKLLKKELETLRAEAEAAARKHEADAEALRGEKRMLEYKLQVLQELAAKAQLDAERATQLAADSEEKMKALKWELVRALSVAAPSTPLAPSVASTPLVSKAGADSATPTLATTTSPRVALNWRLKEGAALRRSSTTVLRSSAAIKALHKPIESRAAPSIQPTTVSLKAVTYSPAPTSKSDNQEDDARDAVRASPVRRDSSADDRASQASHRSASVSSRVSSTTKLRKLPVDGQSPATHEEAQREAVQKLSAHHDDEAPSRASSGRSGRASEIETTSKPKSQSRGGGIAAFIKRKLSGADKQADTKAEKSKSKATKPTKEREIKALAADSDDDDEDAGEATRVGTRRTPSSTDEDAKPSAQPQHGLRRLGDRAALSKTVSRRPHEENRSDEKAKPDHDDNDDDDDEER